MIAVQQPSCRDYARFIGPYLDGELEPATLLDLEAHLGYCGACREGVELLRATRGTLKRLARSPAPVGFRARLQTAMLAEQAREEVREQTKAERGVSKLGWRTVVPVATAAALALFWGAASGGRSANSQDNAARERAGNVSDDVLAEFAHEHSQPLPLDAHEARAVRDLAEKYVGVPVHPSRFERNGVRLVGGRVLPVHQARAAMMQFMMGSGDDSRRVSVFAFKPDEIIVNEADLAPQAVGTAQVQLGVSKGYAVAYVKRGGVAYAVAGDRDDAAQFAAAMQADEP